MGYNSKRILKNTIILYLRMIFIMLIALYTSRVVLKALGIEDYGLYNIVGGVVTIFSFLKSSMTSSTQRFLSYELGRSEASAESNRVFCASVTTHFGISLVLFLLCETVGLWLLNSQVNIPEGRQFAANVIYQFSVVSICINLMIVPYNACVIAHEDMNYFAYISIMDSIFKLLIAIVISHTSSMDRLILYGFLIMLITVANLLVYWIICKKSYQECIFMFKWDVVMIKRIFSFSSWNLLGQMASVVSTQGVSLLINVFYSVAANAAMGVAQQVNHAISGLVANFQTAYQPQITKSYAAGEKESLKLLMYQASKVSFFLIFIVSLPILFNIDDILDFWLDKVPQYTSQFCVYILISSMMTAIGGPLWIAIFATGKIRNYQIVLSIVYILDIFVVYALFRMGFSPVAAVVVKAVVYFLVVLIRLYYCSKQITFFSVSQYVKKVLLPVLASSIVSIVFAYIISLYSPTVFMKLVGAIAILLVSIISAFMIGLASNERLAVRNIIKKVFKPK